MTPSIVSLADAAAVYAAGADVFQQAANEAVSARGVFSVALAGGSTPRGLYTLLAEDNRFRDGVPWHASEIFWGDERHVRPDDPQSNYRMAHEALLSKAPVSLNRVHRVRGEEADPRVAADLYEKEVRTTLRSNGHIPRFDLVLLGLGIDGHTASLFPGTQALLERSRLVVANWVEKLHAYRITMTVPLLNAARLVMFLVTGQEKAAVIRNVLQPRAGMPVLPSQLVRPSDGRIIWLLDAAAASLLARKVTGAGEPVNW